MKALSLKQPWATLIVAGIKPVENRTWSSKYRGKLLIHASKTWDKEGAEWICEKFPIHKGLINHSVHLQGYLIGSVNMIDCVKEYSSKWFFGSYGFVFRDPIEWYREEAIPYKGKLGIFDVMEGDILKEISANER